MGSALIECLMEPSTWTVQEGDAGAHRAASAPATAFSRAFASFSKPGTFSVAMSAQNILFSIFFGV